MKESIQRKLDMLCDRYEEVGALLSDPDVISDQNRYRELSREYAEIEPVAICFAEYRRAQQDIQSAREMIADEPEPEIRDMAAEELEVAEQTTEQLDFELRKLLLPKDPSDGKNVFLEVRAGTGGDEAAIFAGDLFRMYSRFSEGQKWRVEVISQREGDRGGYKEIIVRVVGHAVYSRLKFESGAHRVQRVPNTESQGRIHTSVCTVAVLPEANELEEVDINKADLRVDTFRASGAGGQHVNKTDSAIRLTHIPTGIVVECQDERSQHKNRARAMALLQAKLNTAQQDAATREQSDTRRNLVGSGDRSQRIRTYNFPQGRVTDHRINLTLYKLDEIMEGGGLDELVRALVNEHQADQLAALAE